MPKFRDLEPIHVTVQTHWVLHAAGSGAQLSGQIGEFCSELFRICAALPAINRRRGMVWICIDHVWKDTDPVADKFSHSSVHVRIDTSSSEVQYQRHFVTEMITIFNPKTADILKASREDYRRWLLAELRLKLIEVFQAGTHGNLDAILTRTQMWISGEAQIYSLNPGGEITKYLRPLPQKEDSFFENSLVEGPRLSDIEVEPEE